MSSQDATCISLPMYFYSRSTDESLLIVSVMPFAHQISQRSAVEAGEHYNMHRHLLIRRLWRS